MTPTERQRVTHVFERAAELREDERNSFLERECRGDAALLNEVRSLLEEYQRIGDSGVIASETLETLKPQRVHFFAVASQQMRRILVDYARSGNAQKREAGAVDRGFDEVPVGLDPRGVDLLMLDESLRELQRLDPRASQVVELRFFGGYAEHEIAEVVGVSHAMVRRDWEFARSWLFDRMHGDQVDRPAEH